MLLDGNLDLQEENKRVRNGEYEHKYNINTFPQVSLHLSLGGGR